tara:strand:+ start:7303 stop:8481 length:1179 start_codon:yes stop_codon:yes gene_type:complete
MENNNLYVIYNIGEGKGGHSLSMGDTISSLPFVNFNIINISHFDCVSLKKLGGDNYHRVTPSINIYSLIVELHACVNANKPDLIHAFDDFSYTLCRLVNVIFFSGKLGVLLTKCGGPNPKYNYLYPNPKNIVLFSKENYDWFDNNRNSNLYLIPNRIKDIAMRKSTDIENIIDSQYLNIVCISRITPYYERKILSSIKFVSDLNNSGFKTSLTIIGSVVSNELYEKVFRIIDDLDYVELFIDEKHTYLASEFIHYFDATISTGRGVMESCYMDKITFVPVQNSEYPEILCDDNINDLFSLNFSERTITPTNSTQNIFNSGNISFNISKGVKDFTNKNFRLSSVQSKYKELYDKVYSDENRDFIDLYTIFSTIYFIYRQITRKISFGFKGKIK